MNLLEDNQQKMTEIIFQNRNKRYGAYVMRSSYGATVAQSLGIVLGGVLLLTGILWYVMRTLPLIAPALTGQTPDETIHTISVTVTPPKPTCGGVSHPPAGRTPEQRSESIVIRDSVINETSHAITPSLSANQSTTPAEVGDPVASNDTAATVDSRTEVDRFYEDFETGSPASFRGGFKALGKFISDNIRYPYEAREGGQSGTIHVKFVVDEKGKVGLARAMNNLGFGMEQEALRVVSLLPDFEKPATVKGKPVKSYFMLPIRFRLDM